MGEYRFNINALDAVSSSESNFMQQYNTWGSGNHTEWLERWLKTWTRPRRRAQSSLQNHELISPSKPFGTKQCLPMWQTLLDATSSRMVIKLRVSSVFYVEGLPVVVLWLTVVLDWLTHECRQSGQQMKFHTTGCITLTFNANILYTSLYNLEMLRRMFWTISAYALALISSLPPHAGRSGSFTTRRHLLQPEDTFYNRTTFTTSNETSIHWNLSRFLKLANRLHIHCHAEFQKCWL